MTTIAINDLAASKELDSKVLAGVTGGMGHLIPVDLSTMVNASNKFAEIQSTAAAFTGPQTNHQNALVNNIQAGDKGAFNLNYSPINQDANNTAYAYTDSYPSIFQGLV